MESRVQEYLRKKKIKDLALPKLYIVKSTPEGVDQPVERQVVEIVEGIGLDCIKNLPIDRYKLEGEYPYEVDIVRGETSDIDSGYGTGFGDLWGWSYFSSLSKDDADQYFNEESIRVKNKYCK